MFRMVNNERFLRVDAESGPEKNNKKFMHRFLKMEERAAAEGKQLANMTLEEMDAIWNLVKKENKTA